ncbi:UxaA family hydrolase [Paenibacillus puerhi]|uniref:UxaA family hydrolase n=1 Tax=Paenibacillus puerhi TaxID=2692622 RepID=UPI00135A8A6E|nr:UxaA family hydrolase [Paenibacillus puerhi]
MAHSIEPGADALVMDEADHVATALKDLEAGDDIRYRIGTRVEHVVLLDPVPFGHKISIVAMETGFDVRKYGEVIGRTVCPIEAGRHVHVHNIEGIRGRGDQAVAK